MKYKNAKFTQFEGVIDCEIEHPEYGWVPFSASQNDKEQHSRDLYTQIVSDGQISPYVEPDDLTNSELASNARQLRNSLLSASDWTQVADAPVNQAAWATYRQALRDVPDQENFPSEIAWPAQP